MNKIVILFIIFTIKIDAQLQYSFDYCNNFIDNTLNCLNQYSDDSCTSFIDANLDSLDIHFSIAMFHSNANLINKSNDTSEIMTRLERMKGFGYEERTGSFKLYYLLNHYNKSIRFENISTLPLLDSIHIPHYGELYKYILINNNAQEIIQLFNSINDDLKYTILNTIVTTIEKTSPKYDSIFSCIDSTLQDNLSIYGHKYKYAELHQDPLIRDSLITVVKAVFDAKLDTTNEYNHDWYLKLFRPREFYDKQYLQIAAERIEKQKLALWRKDSIFQIQKREVDSIFQNHFEWRGLSPEELEHYRIQFETGEIYKNHYFYTHPILPDTNRMSAYEKFCYKVRKDTTLYTDDWKPKYYPGDGGRRFDTLTNKQLIAELSGYNYSYLHQQVRPWRDVVLDSSTDVVYLRKISQLIGDRALKGTLTMDSSDRVELNRLIDFCVDIMKHDSNHYWKSECEKILLRLWLPIKPRLLAALTDSNRIMYSFASTYLHAMVTESDVVSLVNSGMSYFNQGNRNEAMKYIMPLEPIADHLHAEEALHIMMPRRKAFRDWETSVKWCGLYIYDALKALGYPK